MKGTGLLYRDVDLVIRIVRDLFNEDVEQMVIDDEIVYGRVKDLLQGMAPEWMASQGVITLEIGIHGIPVTMKQDVYDRLHNGALNGYWEANLDNRDKMPYKRIFTGAIRSIDYIASLPEWDGKNLGVTGSSQGGMLSLVCAGLDSRVTCYGAVHAAMIAINDNPRLKELDCHLLIQVHDEVICECPEANAKECAELLSSLMVGAAAEKIRVPMKCPYFLFSRLLLLSRSKCSRLSLR